MARCDKRQNRRAARPAVCTSEVHEQSAPASAVPDGLTPALHVFALAFLENGFNARRAYLTAHPKAAVSTAGTEGHRALNNPKVRAYLSQRLEDAFRPFQMGGDQALARVAMIASSDIRDLYDEKGELLPTHLWPDHIAPCVRSVKNGRYGKAITLESPIQALRIILEQTGKINAPDGGFDALAAALRADLKSHTDV
jgi:hypothetical protein